MSEHTLHDAPAAEGELYRLLAENVRDYAVFVVDGDGRVQTWTPGAERLLGYREEEILRQSADVFFTPEDLQDDAPRREMQQALDTGRGEDDRWHVRQDGSRFWSSGVMTPLWDEAGRLRGFAKIMRDRTEWKHSEDARQASEARKAAVLETSLDGIITIDHEGRIVEFNPAAERLFGYARGDVLGREMAEVVIPERLRAAHYQGLAHYLATGEGRILNQRLQISALRADGTEFPVELAITRVPVDGPPLFTGYVRDITERESQERRRATQLAVTEVLAEAATIGEAALRMLQVVCENLDWDVGGLWLIEQEPRVLRFVHGWSRPLSEVEVFERASREQVFAPGEGLPGRVWQSATPIWIADIARDGSFPRLAPAAAAGLHGTFAVPILLGGEVLGVAEFFSRSIRQPDAVLLEMMASIGGHIGQFIERKRAEQALRESEERFRGLMEQAPFSVQLFSADGRTIRVNRAWEELWGTTLNQIEDYNILQDRQLETRGVLSYIQRAFAGEPVEIPAIEYDPNQTLPDRTRHADSRRWVAAMAYPLKDRQGRVREVVLVHENMTAQKRAEEALRDSEEKFRLMADTIPQLAWMARPDGHIFWYNRPWYEYTGATPEEMEGWGWQSVHDGDVLPHVLERWQASLASGEPFEMVFPLRGADGRFRPFLTRVNPLRSDDGRILYWFGTNTDISEQKQAEDASRFLADASAALAAVTDFHSTLQKVANLAVPRFGDWCAVDLLEPDGSLRRLAVAHVDASKVQLAHELQQRYPPQPEANVGAPRVARTGESEMAEEIPDALLQAAARDEEHLRILRELGLTSYLCVPMKVRGRVLGVLTFVAAESGRRYGPMDLTLAEELAARAAVAMENARLYAELRDADRRKDEFLAMLAHELRNPLAPIRSGLDVLTLGEVTSEVIDLMRRQVDQVVRLVDDLLDVSRIMRGKVELRRQPVELSQVVNHAVETARPLIDAQQHQLTRSLPAEPVWLDADPVRLAQVLSNLLSNAAKYTEPGGHIWLMAGRTDGGVVIRVQDNGIGIDPELLPRIFDLFTQAERSIDRSQGGLGIGLTVCKSLVEMHGGSISAASEGPGRGSEFAVRLPVLQRAAAPLLSRPQSGIRDRRRILIVDDNVAAARMLALLLSKLGEHEIRTVYDGPAALEAAQSDPPEVVLLDIGLPRMDGYEVARRLRRLPGTAGALIVALTGYGSEEDRRRSVKVGFDEHLIKPPALEDLQRLFEHSRLAKGSSS